MAAPTPTPPYRDYPDGDPGTVGYARSSTPAQSLDLQIDALVAAGCGRIYLDPGASGATTRRPGLVAALDHVRRGDQLVVWRLDRLGRSLHHLIETMETLRGRGIEFCSLTEQMDTTTAGGELVFHLFAAMATFERNLISERTHAGLAAARARGRKGGRPPVMSPAMVHTARRMREEDAFTLDRIAAELRVSRSTVIRALRTPETAASAGRR